MVTIETDPRLSLLPTCLTALGGVDPTWRRRIHLGGREGSRRREGGREGEIEEERGREREGGRKGEEEWSWINKGRREGWRGVGKWECEG